MEKLQKYIFIILLILLPTQLGLHFWPAWSYISGVKVDYLSPILYLTDILVLLLLALEIPRIKLRRLGLLVVLGMLVAANVYFSLSPVASIYKWIKVAEFGLLVWYMVKRAKFEAKWLLVPVLYESVLVAWQFWAQSSIGGFWYWLGERSFNSSTPGIANADINGALVMRPYGTFPHPNVLGGFLTVVLPLVLGELLHNSRIKPARNIGLLVVLLLGYMALFLSMSRGAILVGFSATLLVLWRKFGLGKVMAGALVLLGALGVLVAPRYLALGTETEPMVVREQLNSLAVKQILRSPVWGTGLGTAPIYAWQAQNLNLGNYALAFQPTHNIYLLALAEVGMLGALGILAILGLVIKTRSVPLLSILALGLLDHYFLTLQQGQLVLSLILGLTLVSMKEEKLERR